MPRILLATLLASCFAFVIDVLLGVAGLRFTQVPKGFPPFTLLPIFAGTFGGAVLASVAYAITQAVSKQPERTFLFVAMAVLALSFSLPLRLSFTKSHRFAGVTPTAQMMLVLMHTVVATVSVAALLAKPNQ